MKQLITFILWFCVSQVNLKAQSLQLHAHQEPANLEKPNILALHPYGNFISRIQGHFHHKPVEKIRLNLSLESANIWSAPVTSYIPMDESIRVEVRQYEYHRTQFIFDPTNFETERIDIANDGVIKSLRMNALFPLSANQELQVGVRSFLLTKGKAPFTLLTGDQFIEWFHSHIAGGDDPFARKLFGLDEAGIYYSDRENREMSLKAGDVFVGGIEMAYYIYPEVLSNKARHLSSNIGWHLGGNLSTYNSSMDLGGSYNISKAYHIQDNSWLQFGAHVGALRKNIINFKKDNIDFGSNDFLGNVEAIASYCFSSRNQTKHSFALDFYLQTSFNRKAEFEYSIPLRSGISEKSWVTGLSHLYRNNNYWTLLYSIERKIKTTLYIQQDLTLNNNPDIQTGISMSFNLN